MENEKLKGINKLLVAEIFFQNQRGGKGVRGWVGGEKGEGS